MKCRKCEDLPPLAAHGEALRGRGHSGAEEARLRALVCERCGDLLVPESSMDALLHQLETLARFGLTSDGPPLLVSSAEER